MGVEPKVMLISLNPLPAATRLTLGAQADRPGASRGCGLRRTAVRRRLSQQMRVLLANRPVSLAGDAPKC
jgi:hypothetical protein